MILLVPDLHCCQFWYFSHSLRFTFKCVIWAEAVSLASKWHPATLTRCTPEQTCCYGKALPGLQGEVLAVLLHLTPTNTPCTRANRGRDRAFHCSAMVAMINWEKEIQENPQAEESQKEGRGWAALQNLPERMETRGGAYAARETLLEHGDRLGKRSRTFSRY